MEQNLYTMLLEYDLQGNVYVEQIATDLKNPDDILALWGNRAIKSGLMNKEDAKEFFEDITEDYGQPVAIKGVSNVWVTSFSLGNITIFLNFIKTSTECTSINLIDNQPVPDPPQSLKDAQLQYKEYKDQYIALKSANRGSRELNKQRKKAERNMQYWEIRRTFLQKLYNKDSPGATKNLYTIVFFYLGGIYIKELWIADENLRLLLVLWAEKITKSTVKSIAAKRTYRIIRTKADRLLLMEKVSQEAYELHPLKGLLNVWSTYFTLSEGLGDVIVTKTSPPYVRSSLRRRLS